MVVRRFARGQLGSEERKNLENIADAEGVAPRPLQLFFSRALWDENAVRDELQRKVAESYGDDGAIFVVDETSDAKKGSHKHVSSKNSLRHRSHDQCHPDVAKST